MTETSPVTLPTGFRTAGLHCGIKEDPEKYDLALFVSETPCTAAGVFTTNRVCGAPVKVSRGRVPRAATRAVIISSGNANACTGQRGLDDARWMTAEIAERLGCADEDVLVCSTGVIGSFLPREKLAAGVPALVDKMDSSPQAFHDAARGMMTTDTVPKQAVREAAPGGLASGGCEPPGQTGRLTPAARQPVKGEGSGVTVRVSGAAKGAAMIGPNMATMLAVIMTDAALRPDEADAMLRHAVDRSFNCISVEGHTSTSDSVILLANGAAKTQAGIGTETLQRMIDEMCVDLAQAIVRDAEGAEHLIVIDVSGVRTRKEAHRIAKTIAHSPLVKTAIAGCDPNWGRIVSAVGYAGVELEENDIALSINGTLIYRNGAPADYNAAAVSESMRHSRDVSIEVKLPFGEEAVRFWTSDLTAEYVRMNSEYTT